MLFSGGGCQKDLQLNKIPISYIISAVYLTDFAAHFFSFSYSLNFCSAFTTFCTRTFSWKGEFLFWC